MKFFLSTSLVLLCTLGCAFASTQTPWSSGIIITHDHQLLKGEIRYDYAHDLVMFRETEEAALQTLTTHQVSSFRYYDPEENVMHYFKTYAYQPTAYVTIPSFFEIVVEGEVAYLRKHNPYPYYAPTESRRFAVKERDQVSPHILCYDYYVYLNNEIIRASRFNKEVLPLLEDQNIAIRHHIKENKLRTYDIRDQIQLIQYTNEQLGSHPHTNLSASIRPS
uniref:DUF4105 domain-containing protein n=1 Tax=Roseihalotalea indica TaxID=2867963 RepID=A0AA49JJH5_9BACT|nr:hypothetical protein K4G66_13945 [Tunicatimonas sp. TK19036]